jgi:hypothetical protein
MTRLLRRFGRTRRTALPASVCEVVEERRLLSTVVFADGFEGTGSGLAGWSVRTYSNGGASPKWGPSNVKVFAGARSAYSGGSATSAYANDQHTGLVRQHVSLAGYGSASLSFKYYLNTEAGYDFFSVNVIEPSGGSTSTRTVFRDSGDDRPAGWQAKTLDLSGYAGHNDLGIEFRFDSDHTVAREAPSGVWVDDVRLSADTRSSAGTIRGSVFEDADGDHLRDPAEGTLGGWVVYLDRNQNHRRDSNEAWRSTDASGRYEFAGLLPGTYYVASENRGGFVQTAPTPADVRAASAFDIRLHFDDAVSTALRDVFEAAARRWERIIVGDLPDVQDDGERIDDILIDAAGTDIDGAGGVLAQSSPSAMRDPVAGGRNRAGLPYRGFVEIDADDVSALRRNGTLLDVVTHEMAHALGFGTLWEENGLIKSAGSNDPRFTGAVAVGQYDALFNTSASSVPIEGDGAPGTRDSHWRESTFGDELMTGFVSPGADPISRVTVGSLADLGYVVDLTAADAYVPRGGRPASDPPGVERAVTVSAGKTRSGIDFGHRRTNQRPVVKFLTAIPFVSAAGSSVTLKATGVSDDDGSVMKVAFYRESNGESGVQFGPGGDSLVATDSRPADGFSVTVPTAGVAPGTYTYYAVAVDNAGASSAGGRSAPWISHTVQTPGRISGTVFVDADGDGSRDSGETPLAGCRLYLDANGNDRYDGGETSVLSDAAGNYAFGGLTSGSYTVRSVPPSGYVRTAPSAGEYAIRLGAGESVSGKNFGAAPEARITGRVFNDADGDGARGGTEAGVGGWTVYVDADHDGVFDAGELFARTGSNGTYTLAGLRRGTYTVLVAILSGWRATSPTGGLYEGIALAAGQSRSGLNFGVSPGA